jgi:hypothetical protein
MEKRLLALVLATCGASPSASAREERFAVLTLVSPGPFVAGTVALGESLRAVRPHVAFDQLAICAHNSSTGATGRRLVAAGWSCTEPAFVPNPTSMSRRWPFDYYFKVAAFGMVRYTTVVLVDSDMVVVGGALFAQLFRVPFPEDGILAGRDCAAMFWPSRKDQREIQGGLVALHPSERMYRRLLAATNLTKSIDGGGQGFLSSYFRGHITYLTQRMNMAAASCCVWLASMARGITSVSALGDPPAEHMQVARRRGGKMLCDDAEAARATNAVAEQLLRDERIAVVHYHFQPKPFERKRRRKRLNHSLKVKWVDGCLGDYIPPVWRLWGGFYKNASARLRRGASQIAANYSSLF